MAETNRPGPLGPFSHGRLPSHAETRLRGGPHAHLSARRPGEASNRETRAQTDISLRLLRSAWCCSCSPLSFGLSPLPSELNRSRRPPATRPPPCEREKRSASGAAMGDHEARGDDFEKKAEKKLSGWGLFGSKYEDAAELFDKAANSFKLAKNWSRAAAVYIKIANCHLKGDSRHEAASAYVEAANCYKKFSPQEAAQALNQAVNLFLEIGRLNMAARYSKDIGEIYQQEQDLEKAIDYLERAADLFDSEGQTSQSNGIKQKVAEIAAQLEQYPKATELFEAIARQSVNNNLLKYSARGILLNAGICQLCRGDPVAITNSLERYQEIDPTFSGTREYKLLADLAAAMDEGDIAKFTDAIKEFDSMTRLDPWKTTLLLRAKNELKKKEDDEDDLT